MGDFVESVETPLGRIKFEAMVSGNTKIKMLDLPCTLSNGMTLDRVVACVLVVEPDVDGVALTFTAHLDNESLSGSPESGECLDCVSWESSNWALSLGTEDADALSQRLKCFDIESGEYPISYSGSGLELRLAGLDRGEALSFHFIVAYKRLPDSRECSTWFAVDVPHELANKAMHATSA
jgi:hypothetical protein